MKYFLILLVACVALAAAAPQWLAYPGINTLGGTYPWTRPGTVVAGPTVINGLGGRYIAPGYLW